MFEIFQDVLWGLLAGFILSLVWLSLQLVLNSFSEDQTGAGAIPLAYVFIVAPTCLVAGPVVGLIVGLYRYFGG